MKKTIFISSILAACVACAAEVKVQETTIGDNNYQYLYVKGGEGNFDELTINHIKLESRYESTITVDGKTTINSNIPSGNFYGCIFGHATTFISDSIEFNCLTTYYPSSISIQGTVQTDSFTVNATEDYPVTINITDSGKLEAREEREANPFTIGANVSVKVGNATETAKGSIGLKTVVDGGSLHVNHYASLNGISLKKGDVLINLDHFVSDNSAGVPLTESINLGDITVEGGTMTLDGTSITSDITMTSGADGTSGTLNILGDVKTGALTLNSGTINVGSELKKAALSTTGDLLVDGATLNLINGDLKAVSMNSGSIVVSTGCTIETLTLSGGSLYGDLSGCKMTTADDDEESVKVSVDVTNGDITAVEGTELSGTISEGELTTEAGSMVCADIKDTEITAEGGEISGTISGTSSVTVNSGTTTISGANNDYSGGTVIKGATLVLKEGSSVGTGAIELTSTDTDCGVFDMGGNALTNDLIVTGCIIRNAENYDGDMDVSHELVVEGVARARKVTLTGEGTLVRDEKLGGSMTTGEIDVQTMGDANLEVDLTINDNGSVTLNDGKVLSVKGSLTLGNGVSVVLTDDDYGVGDKLLSSTGTLTMGDVTLVYNDSTVELELQGNSLVLVSKFKQDKADAVAQANWGIATASRTFVNAVRGQRTNTGCIANGRGTAWAAVLGGTSDIGSGDIDLKGAAVGADMKVGEKSSLGVAFGYIDGEAKVPGLRKAEQDGTYVALYGEHGLKKLSATSCLSLDWVAAYGNTDTDWNGMEWEQDSVQLNTRLNWNRKLTDRLCMSVFGGLEYFASESDRVENTKTGSIQNLRGEIGVGARYVAWGTPGTAASYDEKGALVTAYRPGCEKLVLHGEIRYMNDMVRSNPVIEQDGLRGSGDNPGRQGMGIEAGATYRISDRWSASANYGFNTMDDSREHRVNVGASYTF